MQILYPDDFYFSYIEGITDILYNVPKLAYIVKRNVLRDNNNWDSSYVTRLGKPAEEKRLSIASVSHHLSTISYYRLKAHVISTTSLR